MTWSPSSATAWSVFRDPLRLSLYLATLFVLYWIGSTVYDVFLGPLSKFPGPKFWALTQIPRLRAQAAGVESQVHERLHREYGDVVRIGPRELSFANGAQAWRDIYGFKKHGSPQPHKDKVFYVNPAEGVPSILGANDVNHARVRKILSHAFSDKALKDQEPLLKRWMELMRKKLGEHANGIDHVDVMKIYNCTTFDIMGELTFSESLNMLQDSEYSPWVKTIFSSIKTATLFRGLRQFHAATRFLLDEFLFKSESVQRKLREHQRYTSDRVNRRLEHQPEHPDFWTKILAKHEEDGGLTLEEHYANASLFMMAGTETTATALSGATYYLLQNPDCLKKLTEEIRGAFRDVDDVTLDKAARLKYLQAVLQEAMRMYPPLPISLPRTTPIGGSTICDEYVPENVKVGVNHFATYRMEEHFKNPCEFHPERWLGDPEYQNDHLNAVEPFSIGPRNCLGKNLAWHEMRVLLVGVLLHFDLRLDEGSKDWAEQKIYTLWEKKPLMCTLTPVVV